MELTGGLGLPSLDEEEEEQGLFGRIGELLAGSDDQNERASGILQRDLDERDGAIQEYGTPDEVDKAGLIRGELSRGLRPDLLTTPRVDPDFTDLDFDDLDPAEVSSLTLQGADLPTEEMPEGSMLQNGVNFLFGEDMAILGMKWDEKGFDMSLENMMQQWAEHPVMSSITLGMNLATLVFPAIGAVRKGAKLGKYGAKFVDPLVQEKRIFDVGEELLRKGEKVPWRGIKGTKGFKESSLIDPRVAGADPMEKGLRQLLEVGADDGMGGWKHFAAEEGQMLQEMLEAGAGAEAVKKFGAPNIKKALLGDDHMRRFRELQWKNTSGYASPLEKMKYDLQKRFANNYFNLGAAAITPETIRKTHKFFLGAEFDKILQHEIPENLHTMHSRYIQGLATESEALAAFGSEEAFAPAKALRGFLQQIQQDGVDMGLFTKQQLRESSLIDPSVHWKVEKKKGQVISSGFQEELRMPTPVTQRVTDEGIQFVGKDAAGARLPSNLFSASFTHRNVYGTREALEKGYAAGELIVDPHIVAQLSAVHDKAIQNTYGHLAEQIAKHDPITGMGFNQWFAKHADWEKLPDAAKAHWMDMNDVGGFASKTFNRQGWDEITPRLKRMVAIKLGHSVDDVGNIISKETGRIMDDFKLPMMRKDFFEDIFHPEAGTLAGQNAMISTMFLSTALHKTMKTAFNLRTHVTNFVGNAAMLGMAGMNPFSRQAAEDGGQMAKAFSAIAKSRRAGRVDQADMFSVKHLEHIFDTTEGLERYAYSKKFGTRIDMVDELSDPRVQMLIEKQSFSEAEGFGSMERMMDALARMDASEEGAPITLKMAGSVVKALTGVGKEMSEKSKLQKLMHGASEKYLQEDMIPKMMYFMNLRRSGMSIESAVNEVGRRLPQYATVGRSVAESRRFILPWITFPAEMTRIMKNNMMDFPMRTAAMVRIPALAQMTAGITGIGPPTSEEAQEGMREAPMWAQNASTVLLKGGKTTAALLAGSTGAFTGAIMGGAKGGAVGAMVGAAAGGTAGVLGGYAWGDEDEKNLRAWSMGVLPWSSLQPVSTSPEAEPHGLKDMLDLSPMEPFATLMPIMNVLMQRGSFGEDMPVSGPTDAMAKATMGMIGFMSPPLMQKYGMKVGDPNTGFFDLAGGAGRLSAMALGGGIGYAAGGIKGAAAGAGLGLAAGANTIRLQEDLGFRKNVTTGQEGNIIFDGLLNSTLGIGVSYKATPEQRLFNEKMRRDRFGDMRRVYQKQMDYAILNGREDMFNESLSNLSRSFSTEYLNPVQATEKFGEYAKRRLDKIGKHPQLKAYSQEQLAQMLDEAVRFAGEKRGEAAKRRVKAIQDEMMLRIMQKEQSGLVIGGFDYDVDLVSGLIGPAAMAPKKKRTKKGGRGVAKRGGGKRGIGKR
jgi:hypothetical protein